MILSNNYANKFLDLLRGYSFEPIAKYYIGILNVSGEEVSGDSYSRLEYDATNIAWYSTQGTVEENSTGDSKTISNMAPIQWSSILETWGEVNTLRFYSSSSGEDYIFDIPFSSVVLTTGDTFEFLEGELRIKVS